MRFNFNGEGNTYTSRWGACFSMCVLVAVLLFALQQLIVWKGRQDTSYMSAELQDYLDSDYTFTEADGMQMAFAVVGTGDEVETRPMEEYLDVEISVVSKKWAEDAKPEEGILEIDIERTILEHHPCSEEELAKFYPQREN